MWALENKHFDIAKLLLEHEPSPQVIIHDKVTTLTLLMYIRTCTSFPG